MAHPRRVTSPPRIPQRDETRHRALLQNEADGVLMDTVSERTGLPDVAHPCTLSPKQISELLDAEQRTWRVRDAALETLDDDVQRIIDCTLEGDTVFFGVQRTIKLSRRIEIPHRLILGTLINPASEASAVTPHTIFRCRRNRGAFLLRYN